MLAVSRILNAIFKISGAIAALFLIAILVIIIAQMLARWSGNVFPGATDYAGYCMAGASFFALAYALNYGSHIRVSLLLSGLGPRRIWGEIWCTGVAAIIATIFARYAIKANIWSEKLNDVSQGQDATPLWIPQIAMSIGTVLLALALWDHVLRMILTDHQGIREPELSEMGE